MESEIGAGSDSLSVFLITTTYMHCKDIVQAQNLRNSIFLVVTKLVCISHNHHILLEDMHTRPCLTNTRLLKNGIITRSYLCLVVLVSFENKLWCNFIWHCLLLLVKIAHHPITFVFWSHQSRRWVFGKQTNVVRNCLFLMPNELWLEFGCFLEKPFKVLLKPKFLLVAFSQ